VVVEEVRWDKENTARWGIIIFSVQREFKVINWEQDFLYNREKYKQLRE
jgi:hypothetical protein